LQKKHFLTQNTRGITKMKLIDCTKGDVFDGPVKIVRKIVPGPVIFVVTDGTKNIDAVIKQSNYNVDDVVNIQGYINERQGKLQLDIQSMSRSDASFDQILLDAAKPVDRPLSIQSDRLTTLRPYFVRIATKIRAAVMSGQPIVIRHHNDTDGFCSGLSLEEPLKLLMADMGVDPAYNVYRNVSRAPFYEVTDMFKDISQVKRFEKFGQKKPLIIVIDNGSTPEDVFAEKTLHMLGVDIIVIDHHDPVEIEGKKTSVCPYLLDHINPYMEGLDSKTCAGMLGYEIGRLIHEKYENYVIPATAGIGDRCDIPETDAYIEKSGRTREDLKKLGDVINYMAYQLKFDAAGGVLEEIFNRQEFVEMIDAKIEEGYTKQLVGAWPNVQRHAKDDILFATIDVDKFTVRYLFPTAGRVVERIQDKLVAEAPDKKIITVGFMPDIMIFRATHPLIPVPVMVKELAAAFPSANVEGGGHECAGSIKFLPAYFDEILGFIMKKLGL
jgi:RecJ-like exonuclease